MDTLQRDGILEPVARPAGTGRALDVLGAPYVLKATSAETGGRFCCIEQTTPAGSGVPPHTHTREDEAFYVLSGTMTFECAGSEGPLRLGPGSFFFGPRGRQHSFRNETAEEARMLVFAVPGEGIESMFAEMDAAARDSGSVPPPETVVAIAARHGIVIPPPQA